MKLILHRTSDSYQRRSFVYKTVVGKQLSACVTLYSQKAKGAYGAPDSLILQGRVQA